MIQAYQTVSDNIEPTRLHRPDLRLSQREKLILRLIIHNFILTAEPMGSRSLVRRFSLKMSAATARNVMADLEAIGLLTHPHTSAGRIPTDLGYRFYVDEMMQVEELPEEMRKSIQEQIKPLSPEVDILLDRISSMVAEVSSMLSVIVAPDMTSGVLEKIEMIRVANDRIMVVIIVSSGLVRTINLELISEISDGDIYDAAQLINQKLAGLRLTDIPNSIIHRLSGDHRSSNSIIRLFLDFPEKIFTNESTSKMHIGGTRHVLKQPEYQSPDKIKGIIELVEDRDIIVHLFKERQPGVMVTIGQENQGMQFKDFSVISSTYRIGDASGSLGIIGPTRMNYSKLVSLVGYASQLVSEKVSCEKKKDI